MRVHELAKELGIESKEMLAYLKDAGEFVKSASSVVESPVVKRMMERFEKEKLGKFSPEAAKKAEKAAAKAKKPVAKTTSKSQKSAAEPAADAESTPPASATESPTPETAPAPDTLDAETPAPAASSPAASATPQPKPEKSAPSPSPAKPQAKPSAHPDIPKPGASIPKPGARPGNNPFAASQGMGKQPQRRPRPDGDRRGGQRPQGSGSEQNLMPRPGGTGGMPRPNPAMMPKHQSSQLGQAGSRPGRGGGRGRGGRPGSGGPGGGGRFGGPPMGGPGGMGAPGRGRGRGGTQGAFGRGGSGNRRRKSKKQRRQEFDEMEAPTIGGVRVRKGGGQTVRLRRGASLTDLAEKIGVDAAALVQVLFHMGEMVTATQSVSDDTLELLGAELEYNIQVVSPEDEDRELLESFDLEFGEDEGDEDDLEVRPPVVTVMGHVDHGKTKLLDAFRHSNVQTREAGGITQKIGAYQVEAEVEGEERAITFIDTPGHEAFTAMRARGAKSTDIAVLVVAADDGVMPQTIEAMNHAMAADVPIVVAVNKIDKDTADPTRVRGQLSEYGLIPEEYGGDTQFVDVSAVTRQGLDELLEAIVLTADAALDLRANPDMDAQGVAIEAHLDKGRGAVATVLVHRGTLRIGDSIVAGSAHGRVRAMINDQGENVDEAPPSMPVQVLGLTSVPGAGDNFLVVEDDRVARQIADKREARMRAALQARTSRRKTLDQLFEQLEKGETQELLLILKGDGAGSVEALEDALTKIEISDEVGLRVIDRGVGAITETNVSLAAASKAVIIGFNVRPTPHAAKMADEENVDIRSYSVIYDAIDEIEAALKGMLKPIYKEQILGQAEIREIFRSSKIGNIAGCMVLDGVIRRNAKARLIRDGVVIQDTSIASLRREKDDVTEVREGFECGLTLHNYNDIKTEDVVEVYEMVEQERE